MDVVLKSEVVRDESVVDHGDVDGVQFGAQSEGGAKKSENDENACCSDSAGHCRASLPIGTAIDVRQIERKGVPSAVVPSRQANHNFDGEIPSVLHYSICINGLRRGHAPEAEPVGP